MDESEEQEGRQVNEWCAICRYHQEQGDAPLLVERDERQISVRLPHDTPRLSLCVHHADALLKSVGLRDSIIEAMCRKGGKP